jgi:hypothetical protein
MKSRRQLQFGMELYFNEVFEAVILQANEKNENILPTISELAALYYDTDEVTAAKYLRGEKCTLDAVRCIG